MVLSALLVVAAAAFLWRNNSSAAFVTAALGACAWFLSYRAQLKTMTRNEEPDDEHLSQPDDDE